MNRRNRSFEWKSRYINWKSLDKLCWESRKLTWIIHPQRESRAPIQQLSLRFCFKKSVSLVEGGCQLSSGVGTSISMIEEFFSLIAEAKVKRKNPKIIWLNAMHIDLTISPNSVTNVWLGVLVTFITMQIWFHFTYFAQSILYP